MKPRIQRCTFTSTWSSLNQAHSRADTWRMVGGSATPSRCQPDITTLTGKVKSQDSKGGRTRTECSQPLHIMTTLTIRPYHAVIYHRKEASPPPLWRLKCATTQVAAASLDWLSSAVGRGTGAITRPQRKRKSRSGQQPPMQAGEVCCPHVERSFVNEVQ